VSDQSRNQYSWLEAAAVRNASDLALGCILLGAAAIAILDSRELSELNARAGLKGPGTGFFSGILGWLLAGTAILILARGAARRAPQYTRWRVWQLLLLIGVIAADSLGRWFGFWRNLLLLSFGPAEHAANSLLFFSIVISLSRRSRLRAVGLVLLGLLLALVGLDSATDVPRLTMGVEELMTGFNLLFVTLGLFLVADSLICLASPSLLLTTYTRLISGWRDPILPWVPAAAMRVVAALVIAASCYLLFIGYESAWDIALPALLWDIGFLALFGVLGVACKVLGWNRLVLLLGFFYGERLESDIRYTLLASKGDIVAVASSPLAVALVCAAGLVLVMGFGLSLRRSLARTAGA
jgi:TctA family transporter